LKKKKAAPFLYPTPVYTSLLFTFDNLITFTGYFIPMIDYENLKKLNEPFFQEYQSAFQRTIESGWYILGKEVETFEQDYAR
jgi:hypothetical protein